MADPAPGCPRGRLPAMIDRPDLSPEMRGTIDAMRDMIDILIRTTIGTNPSVGPGIRDALAEAEQSPEPSTEFGSNPTDKARWRRAYLREIRHQLIVAGASGGSHLSQNTLGLLQSYPSV